MTTHEKLVLARNTLAKRGLSKGGFIDSAGRVCAYGALVVGRMEEGSAKRLIAMNRLDVLVWVNHIAIQEVSLDRDFRDALGFVSSFGLFHWSDNNSLEEVLARFDEAIARTAPLPEDPMVVEATLESCVGAV